jgi:flagellar basal-body rod protein FlgB
MKAMSNSTTELVKKLLDYTTIKQKVISKNIANANTRGYKKEDVKFETFLSDSMSSSLKTTNSKHLTANQIELPNSQFNIIHDDSPGNLEGNNVDIDSEMAEMAKNTMMFKFASRKIHSYYTTLQKVIKGG